MRLPDEWSPDCAPWRCAICKEPLEDGGEYLDGWGYCHEKCVEEERKGS